MRHRIASVGLFVLLAPLAVRADDGADFFEAKIRPVLVEHCHACHSDAAKKVKGGLKLDTPEAIRRGGDSGPLFTDGDSLLVKAVNYADDGVAMPPKGKLPDRVIADIRQWVRMGAPMPAAAASVGAARTRATGKDHWAFRPAREHPAPAVSDAAWPTGKIDRFILRKLDEEGLVPSLQADRRVLARRVYYDLTGLPPTAEEVEEFVADPRVDAYERLVDGLLASPRFGEKWARHWFDVARYAEDNPTSESTCQPPRFPFRYRDWVIRAVNNDVPYDRFVRFQLAADLLPGTPPADLAALGFLGLSPVYHKEPKLSKDVIAEIVANEWDERLDTITRGFLGLTVACARCHDHKFDPITAEDYYALAGVMANTQVAERPLAAGGDALTETVTSLRLALVDTNLRLSYARDAKKTAIKEGKNPAPFDPEIEKYQAALKQLRQREKELPTDNLANAVWDAGTRVNGADPAWTVVEYDPRRPVDLPVYVRGNPARPGPAVVLRRFLPVLSAGDPRPLRDGSGRRELAEAVVGDAAGLTARVFVNRVWGWTFGKPLVASPSNFGTLGDKPTHPELLDDLAARFAADGWSLKRLVREMVTSATYRQASKVEAAGPGAKDAENRWLGRANVRRLEAEQWRDAMLRASGRLNLKGGGPSDDLDDPATTRRTVYGKVSRQRPSDVHRLFDLPDPKAHGEKRDPSITPVQQLYFLNSPFVRRAAAEVARLSTVDETDPPADVAAAVYRRVLLRDPRPAEVEAAVRLARSPGADGRFQWELVAQVLLASNEFLFLN